MPCLTQSLSSLPALGRGGAVGLLAREQSRRAAGSDWKEMPPLRPSPGRGDKGGISSRGQWCAWIARSAAVRCRRATKRAVRLARRWQAARLDREQARTRTIFQSRASGHSAHGAPVRLC